MKSNPIYVLPYKNSEEPKKDVIKSTIADSTNKDTNTGLSPAIILFHFCVTPTIITNIPPAKTEATNPDSRWKSATPGILFIVEGTNNQYTPRNVVATSYNAMINASNPTKNICVVTPTNIPAKALPEALQTAGVKQVRNRQCNTDHKNNHGGEWQKKIPSEMLSRLFAW